MYYYGKHVEKDIDAAFFWYSEAWDFYYECHSYERASID